MDNMETEDVSESDFKSRPYQDLLLEVALKKNTIIYLPTGAGKTYIVLMAMIHMKNDLKGSISEGGKRTIFLANTQALAKQQGEYIRKITSLKTKVFTGDMDVDNWKREKWYEEFDDCQVITATCQIVLDVIRHGYVKFEYINLIVFDECHHAKRLHPMHQLMNIYHNTKGIKLPRVIGLTGVLVTDGSPSKVIPDMEALEVTFRANIATVKNVEEFQNVLVYSTKPTEVLLDYSVETIKPCVFDKVNRLVDCCLCLVENWEPNLTKRPSDNLSATRKRDPMKNLKFVFRDFLHQLNDLGTYGASVAIMSVIIELELKKRSAESISFRNLVRTCITYAERIRHLLIQHIRSLFDENEGKQKIILSCSTPKLKRLLSILQQISSGKQQTDLKCLIFVQRRLTAKNIYHIIREFAERNEQFPIVPEFMVGQSRSMPESIETFLDIKWNRSVLDRFKQDKCNLIVASSVLEEGIDVQQCNYVIAYDTLKTFRAYIQTKGRARMEVSQYIIMVDQTDQFKYIKRLKEYNLADQNLKKYIIGRIIDQLPPVEEVRKHFEPYPEPFITSVGARLDEAQAISLLNRYCMELPKDSFSFPFVSWEEIDTDDEKFIVSVRLPLQSSVKDEFISNPRGTIKSAKRSAAFKACKMLYSAGELNENLLPISSKKRIELVDPLYFKHWQQFGEDKDAGEKKKKRVYNIWYPEELCSAMPKVGVECYMYIMHLEVAFERNDNNFHIIDLLSTTNQYGILTTKKLPKLASMPLFLSQGQVNGMFSREPNLVKIESDQELERLINFHVMLFRDILNIRKNFFAKDYRNEENSYLIVPTINNGLQIDWSLVNNFQNLKSMNQVSEVQRARLKFVPEDYLNRVVLTWYSCDQDVRYVVTKVRTDLKPNSPFPNPQFSSFANYVKDKYNVNVVQNDQFLLECKQITTKLDRFNRGMGEYGAKKKVKQMDDIILIPELCHNFMYPGDMWLRAVFIPCMLHRLHYMLIAEDIRRRLNQYLGINVSNYEPKPLIVDTSLKQNSEEHTESVSMLPILNTDEVKPEKKHVKTINETLQHSWKEYEEPCDIDRRIFNVYKVELDYYYQFICKNLENMDLNNVGTSDYHLLQKVPAICDVSVDEKYNINILNIFENSVQKIEQCEILTAITAASGHDNFNLERLEILGDSFLKFSISFLLLQNHIAWNEGHLTAVKGKLVSNRNLLYHAIIHKIPSLIKTTPFKAQDDWQPPLLKVPNNIRELILSENISADILWQLELDAEEFNTGICKTETISKFCNLFSRENSENESYLLSFIGQQYVADKTCADVMEALLGVCLKNLGIRNSFKVLGMFGICPPGIGLSDLLDIKLGSPRLRTDIKDREVDEFLINYKELEENLGYTFNDRAYLLQALTHPSFPTNRITGCYQQLEFIGDAILDFLVTCYIFEKCNNITPGKLTDLRSALVNNITLGCLTVRHKFHQHILSQNAGLTQAISNFYEFQKTQSFNVTDQVQILVGEEDSEVKQMADFVEVPKTLGDIFESLIGAIFLDCKNDLKTTWKVIYRLMSNELETFMRNIPINVVRRLYESNASPKFGKPFVEDEIVMVDCKFTCKNEIRIVTGFGKNKEQAKVAAAKLALKTLEEE